ncbi:MAG: tRNA (adenosine(37)-N6)-dimethylallyltransferase MiaA [Chloroflexi bacterium]|nr:tRNA (adenosine(37)-N6)-dimethylallyltransferase MiaA [Chloroflexota bacterium]
MPPLIAIVGPTGVGKSALALALAQRLGGEIIGADSRQVYKHLDIGTAKPTPAERAVVPHHLIDLVEPDQEFTLAHYLERARQALAAVHSRGALPLLVGGTGLYIKAILEGWSVPLVAPDWGLRRSLEQRAEAQGRLALWEELQRQDPQAAASIDPRNLRRVIRALEVRAATGRPFSEQTGREPPPFRALTLGLTAARPLLYQRIDQRVEAMLAAGWLEEVRVLLARGYDPSLPALSGLGYRELAAHLRGELTLPEAVERIKFRTHRFARSQYAWFRLADKDIRWFNLEDRPGDKMIELAEGFIREVRDE